jgi:hypothetical protein
MSCGSGYNDDPDVTGYLTCGWYDCYEWWQSFPYAGWICSFVRILIAHLNVDDLDFRSLFAATSLPERPKEATKGGVRAPLSVEDDEYDNPLGIPRFRLPQNGNVLLALHLTDGLAEANREALGRAIDSKLLVQMYEKRFGNHALSLTATGLFLCEAVRGLTRGHLSWSADEALRRSKGFI